MTMIDRITPGAAGAKRISPMDPAIAAFLRRVCTMFALHRSCPHKVCRRARACATRHVVCYQSREAEMQPIMQSIIARIWIRSVEAGKHYDVAPASRDGWLRKLAWEEGEIARIRAGDRGGDDALTPYQLWLKNWAECLWRPSGRPRPAGGEAYDPEARQRNAPWTPPKIVRAAPEPAGADAAGSPPRSRP